MKKYAMYRGIKVELTGKKSKWFGVKLTEIKFNNGTPYDCPTHELTEIKEQELPEPPKEQEA
jgi:hypothetical protein